MASTTELGTIVEFDGNRTYTIKPDPDPNHTLIFYASAGSFWVNQRVYYDIDRSTSEPWPSNVRDAATVGM